ncbi:MAG TPA: alcohol dehydrogenase [Candidatus Mediterraneibacter quadrami]|uniref:Alcohol dehydrogenase n=1 Tax=Candidatus Mediterraneibacter quadrami TaxID=2838684 RepID=A0A9D2RAI2_9FIRM|nr:alcohol dehydrogenase [Candidatus Mediterraneibacter quadrami]
MKAVVYKGKGKIALENRPVPKIQDDRDAIIKVTLTTICSSDIHIKHGAVPRAVPGTILGHEFVGRVVETGSAVKKINPGDRVSVNVETFCGECFFCKRGFVNNCTDPDGGWALGCRIDGGQAEYVRIPFADNGLTVIPDHVSDEQALFNGDILSTGYWAAKIGEINPADTVAVIGAGPAGLCTMMCARLYTPARIIAIDTDEYRLNLAKEKGLADITLVPGRDDLEKVIKELTDGRGADTVFEVAGGTDTFQTAWKIARPNAVVVVVAMYEEAQEFPLPDMYGKNLVFKTGGVDGSYCREIMDLTACGKLDAGFLITHRCSLNDIMNAYHIFENKKEHVIKYAVNIEGR